MYLDDLEALKWPVLTALLSIGSFYIMIYVPCCFNQYSLLAGILVGVVGVFYFTAKGHRLKQALPVLFYSTLSSILICFCTAWLLRLLHISLNGDSAKAFNLWMGLLAGTTAFALLNTIYRDKASEKKREANSEKCSEMTDIRQ